MRKSFELVWNYPARAARLGQQGVVALEFVIFQNGSLGRVKVLQSSGFSLLDTAAVRALRLASPYSPLPKGLGKDQLLITGSFRYVLNGYGGS